MVRDKPLMDLIHDDAAMSTFDKAPVGVYKSKPEAQIVVLDFVEAPFAFFRLFLRDGNLALQNIQINQGLEILS